MTASELKAISSLLIKINSSTQDNIKKMVREILREELGFMKKDLLNEVRSASPKPVIKGNSVTKLAQTIPTFNHNAPLMEAQDTPPSYMMGEMPVNGANPFMDLYAETLSELNPAELRNYLPG